MRFDSERSRHDLERLQQRCDIAVASMHWGRNYKKRNPRQTQLAMRLVDAGARLVVGHHPHVAHPIEIVDDAVICYSLGNGPLGTPGRFHSGRPPYGLVVSFDFDQFAVLRRMEVTPILVDNSVVAFRPEIADDDRARGFVRTLLPSATEWANHDGGTFSTELQSSLSEVL